MKNIIVTTYCTWTSYGSILQSYALKKALLDIGIYSSIIKTSKEKFDLKFSFSTNMKKNIYNIYNNLLVNKIKKKFLKNNSFINDKIDIIYFNSYEDVKTADLDTDIFLAGSDQIFHPDLCDPLFFLDFVPKDKLKISYAASMGVTTIKKNNEEDFRRLLNNFDYISVREVDNVPIIRRYTDRDVQVHIDPTFLIAPFEWRSLEKKYPINERYILVYPLYWNKKFNKQLKEIKKRTGYKIVTLCSGFNRAYGDIKIFDAGVEEFLWLIDNSEAVITSSFHGVALSTIFNKDFSVVINPNAPSRVSSLLKMLDLKPIDISELTFKHIDYLGVNERIKKEQKRSYEYLNKVINYEE